ncbi:hypothetical protein ACFLX7_04575 [Chloroflexota bacterium]
MPGRESMIIIEAPASSFAFNSSTLIRGSSRREELVDTSVSLRGSSDLVEDSFGKQLRTSARVKRSIQLIDASVL